MEHTMKRLYATLVILVLSSSVSFAQHTGGATPSAVPNRTARSFAPPSNQAIVSHDRVTNLNSSQNLNNLSNPQDLTRSGAGNPQKSLAATVT